MRILVITVAGCATRFSKSVGKPCLKCIYFERQPEEALIYRLIHKSENFDKFVIVGGYKIDELRFFIDTYLSDMKSEISVVENPFYSKYGSGYSLYLGLKKAVDFGCGEIVFAEGDLHVDDDGFNRVALAEADVITFNRNPIEAKTAVAFYFDEKNKVHYVYDTGHSSLSINEPFLAIYNSGQIWKFSDVNKVKCSIEALSRTQWQGTNLEFIQEYFGKLERNDYIMIEFKEWINCNTIEDFKKMKVK